MCDHLGRGCLYSMMILRGDQSVESNGGGDGNIQGICGSCQGNFDAQIGCVHRFLGESWAFGAQNEGVFCVWGLVLGEGVDVDGVWGGGECEGFEACEFEGCEGCDPVGLVLDLGEGDGEGVSHGDSEGFSVEWVAAFGREEDVDLGAAEGGDGAED